MFLKILFLASRFPYPAHSGGSLRLYGLIEGIVKLGHQIDLFCMADAIETQTPLHQLCGQIVAALPPHRRLSDRLRDIAFTTYADIGRRFWSDAAFMQLEELIQRENYDIVQGEGIEMAMYLLRLHEKHPDLRLVYGSQNAEADLQRGIFKAEIQHPRRWIAALYSWIQWRRIARFEKDVCTACEHVIAVSEADRELFAHMTQTEITVVKNGITVANYDHITANNDLGAGALVFTGSMGYRPNVDGVVWFAENIFANITHSAKHFYIVGNRPAARVLDLQAHEQITVTGYVESIEPYLAGAKVYLVPLRMGSGTRLKILEAMAAGCPVVSTSIGALGLGAMSGEHLILADTPQAFAEAVEMLLNNDELRQKLIVNGRQFVERYFDWSVIVPNLEKAYQQMLASTT